MYILRKYLLLACLLVALPAAAQRKDTDKIKAILARQSTAWNEGNIEGFMEGYWPNDSLMFIGKKGITYGWQNTLDNYRKSYPDKEAMGKLQFDVLHIKKLSARYCSVTGRWHLTRTAGNLEGYFTLLFRKIKGQWVIIADHSS